MSTGAVPTVWRLSRRVREGTHCVWCFLLLGEQAVAAGVARGYWGAHDLSVTVYAHPECVSPRSGR